MSIFGKTKMLEEKIGELKKELIEADEISSKCSEKIVELTNMLQQSESECSRLQDKVNVLEKELNILRSERKEIEDKTKNGIDKDAVIVQLILEKDRLAIENLKYHERMIEKDRIVVENCKLSLMATSMCQIPYYPMTGYCNSFRY